MPFSVALIMEKNRIKIKIEMGKTVKKKLIPITILEVTPPQQMVNLTAIRSNQDRTEQNQMRNLKVIIFPNLKLKTKGRPKRFKLKKLILINSRTTLVTLMVRPMMEELLLHQVTRIVTKLLQKPNKIIHNLINHSITLVIRITSRTRTLRIQLKQTRIKLKL